MTFKRILSASSLLLALSFTGCGGSGSGSMGGSGTGSSGGSGNNGTTNVYVAGYSMNTISVFTIPTYWENGMAADLTGGVADAAAEAIAVDSSGDVYVAGYTSIVGRSGSTCTETYCAIATYWKNGTPANLTDGTEPAIAYAIAVDSSGNVYVAGSTTNASTGFSIATYWKNGTAFNLAGGTIENLFTNYAAAYAIAVDSSDNVYVAGYTTSTTTGNSIATYWKNGTAVNLTDGTEPAIAYAIAVDSSDDVYVAGYTTSATTAGNSIAIYWKNGTAVDLTDGTEPAIAYGIAVDSRGDVYVAGDTVSATNRNTIATYWKNGTAVNLTDGVLFADAYAIAVDNSGDVYVAGDTNPDAGVLYGIATLWKNGTATNLTNGPEPSAANGIALSSE